MRRAPDVRFRWHRHRARRLPRLGERLAWSPSRGELVRCVLLAIGCAKSESQFGDMCTALGVDRGWFYRFTIGFDQGRALSVLHPETLIEIGKDSVSLAALRIRREFVRDR